jgi:hypothetical protein
VNTTYKMPETAFGMELPYIKMFGPFEGVWTLRKKCAKFCFPLMSHAHALVILSCDDNWMISQVAVEMISWGKF